ncbi:hypothetical protein BB559_002820, partial [Furculomyces boomerangus]
VSEISKIISAKTKQKFDEKHKIVDIPSDTFVMLQKDIKPPKLEKINKGPFKVIQQTSKGFMQADNNWKPEDSFEILDPIHQYWARRKVMPTAIQGEGEFVKQN